MALCALYFSIPYVFFFFLILEGVERHYHKMKFHKREYLSFLHLSLSRLVFKFYLHGNSILLVEHCMSTLVESLLLTHWSSMLLHFDQEQLSAVLQETTFLIGLAHMQNKTFTVFHTFTNVQNKTFTVVKYDIFRYSCMAFQTSGAAQNVCSSNGRKYSKY